MLSDLLDRVTAVVTTYWRRHVRTGLWARPHRELAVGWMCSGLDHADVEIWTI